MSKPESPKQPRSRPAQAMGGMKPSSSLPATGLGGGAVLGGSLGSSPKSGGLPGVGGVPGLPGGKAAGKPAGNGPIKQGQKSGGKPTGVPRRTAG